MSFLLLPKKPPPAIQHMVEACCIGVSQGRCALVKKKKNAVFLLTEIQMYLYFWISCLYMQYFNHLVLHCRFFGGFVLDIKRKAPHYLSDYTDAISLQCLASFLFLYCACMSPVITFGGLLGEATEGRVVRGHHHHQWNPRFVHGFSIGFISVFIPISKNCSFIQQIIFHVFPERHRVSVRRVHDWNSLLPFCWSAPHHPGQHGAGSRLWENPI